MKLKALAAGLLAAALCFSAAGCGGDSETEPVTSAASSPASGSAAAHTFTLAYSSTDTLNPYTAATKSNQEISQLLFDPLVKLDANFEPVFVLAETITLDGTSCVIRLRDAQFSDGSQVTAEDVTYSIARARESTTRYKTQVDNIRSASAANSSTVSLTLHKTDPYAVNLLDFPIIKQNSDSRTDADNQALPPIGSGRYTYDAESQTLTANPSYMGGSLNISTITLTDTPDDEALEHAIEVGSLSMYYTDLSDNTLPKMTGKSQSVPLNNLVYLGVNFSDGLLSHPEVRQAVSAALNRTVLAASAYYDHALPASSPFPSVWSAAAAMDTLPLTPNTDQVVANLEKIGYNTRDDDGFFVNANGQRLSLQLLCNVDNSARLNAAERIKEQLAEAGIEITVRSVNWEAYNAEIAAGSFDLYLGEVKLTNNMDITQLVTYGGTAAFGLPAPVSSQPAATSAPTSSADTSAAAESGTTTSAVTSGQEAQAPVLTTADVVGRYYAGEAMLSDVMAAFASELPVIPLLHRCGQVTYSSDLAVGPGSTVSDIFFDIASCSFAS